MSPQAMISHYLQKHDFGQFCPKAVLFDMDGVIYDSMPNHAVSWHEAMARCQLDMPLSGAYQYEGMRGVETIRMLARQQWHRELSEEEAREMYAVKSALYAARPKAPKMAGIVSLMTQIKAMDLHICVVTGSGQHSLLDRLLTDFEGLVSADLLVTAFDVAHGKPDAEPYLRGLEKCGGLQPWQAIVVENAPLGVRAAAAARCFTIAVNTGPLDDDVLWQAGADMVVSSMPLLADGWADFCREIPLTLNDDRL